MVPSSGSTIQVGGASWTWPVVPGNVFLAEKAVIRPRLGELLAQGLLGAAVGRGDEIARALERHLQMLDLAEIALEPAPGAMRRFDHDIENRGVLHGVSGNP